LQDLREQVRAALKDQSRTKAKQILKRAKRMEATADKKRNLLDNIDQVTLSL
jgi:hypothetical protein